MFNGFLCTSLSHFLFCHLGGPSYIRSNQSYLYRKKKSQRHTQKELKAIIEKLTSVLHQRYGIPPKSAFIIFFLLVIYDTYKTLSASHECEHDNPNLALFEYDKNKPQRLSFLGDIDMKTGKREKSCIRSFFASTIQVEPTCNDDSDPDAAFETYFHEVI